MQGPDTLKAGKGGAEGGVGGEDGFGEGGDEGKGG